MYSRKPFGCNCFPGLLFGWLVSGAPTHQLAPLITSSRKSSYLCSIKPQTTDVSHSGASSVIKSVLLCLLIVKLINTKVNIYSMVSVLISSLTF